MQPARPHNKWPETRRASTAMPQPLLPIYSEWMLSRGLSTRRRWAEDCADVPRRRGGHEVRATLGVRVCLVGLGSHGRLCILYVCSARDADARLERAQSARAILG